jgi:hypothetical protein
LFVIGNAKPAAPGGIPAGTGSRPVAGPFCTVQTVEEPPRLASIHIYPLKAGRGVDLSESAVEPWGLAGDCRWLVVDGAGRFVSQREEPALAGVIAAYPAAGADQVGWRPARADRCDHPVRRRVPAAEGRDAGGG